MRKPVVLGGLLVCAGLALAAVIWASAQADAALRQVQAAVERATGRTLSVGGGAGWSIWPLAIVIEDARLASAGQLPAMAARELRIETSWRALFTPALIPERITLIEPRFNLAIDGNGQVNWPQGPWAGSPVSVMLERGTLAWLDERSGQVIAVTGIDGVVSALETEAAAFRGHGVWNKQRFALDASVKSLPRLMQDGSPADFLLRAPAIDLDFEGRLSLAKGLALVGQASARIDDVRAFLAWRGTPLPDGRGLRAASASGALDVSGGKIMFEGADLALDGMKAQGRIGVDLTGQAVAVSGRLEMEALDLNAYAAASPMGFAALAGIEARFDIETQAITLGRVSTGPARLALGVKDGRLEADVKSADLYGGKGSGMVVLDGGKDTPALRASLSATGVDAAPLLHDATGINLVEGTANLSLSLHAGGNSYAEMAAALNGAGQVTIAKGTLRGIDPSAAIRAVSQQVSEGWPAGSGGAAAFDRLAFSFTVEDGVVATPRLEMLSPSYNITAKGEADIPRQAIDFTIEPRLVLVTGAMAGLPVAIVAKGPWGAPRLYPDMPGILDDPKAGFAALRKLGLPDLAPTDIR